IHVRENRSVPISMANGDIPSVALNSCRGHRLTTFQAGLHPKSSRTASTARNIPNDDMVLANRHRQVSIRSNGHIHDLLCMAFEVLCLDLAVLESEHD